MATFRKFEDIHAWQKAREVNRLSYYVEQRAFDTTYNSLGEISRMIISLSHHLQNFPNKTF